MQSCEIQATMHKNPAFSFEFKATNDASTVYPTSKHYHSENKPHANWIRSEKMCRPLDPIKKMIVFVCSNNGIRENETKHIKLTIARSDGNLKNKWFQTKHYLVTLNSRAIVASWVVNSMALLVFLHPRSNLWGGNFDSLRTQRQ